MLGRRTTKALSDGEMLGLAERPPSPSLSVASDLGEVSKRIQGDEELRCVIAVLRHGMLLLSLSLLLLLLLSLMLFCYS